MKQTERAAQSAGSRVLDFVVASAAPLILWFSFLNVYTYDPVGVPCSEIDGGGSYVLGICHDSGESGAGATAWHGFFSWSAMLLLLVREWRRRTAAVTPADAATSSKSIADQLKKPCHAVAPAPLSPLSWQIPRT